MNPKNINEQFEDAVFSMLMADVAEAEGKRLLEVNKQLQGDPEAAVPEEVSSRCLKAIKREFNRRNLRNIRRTCARVFQRAAIVILVVVACFSAAYVTSEAFRVNVMNYVIEIFDEKIDLGLVLSDNLTSEVDLNVNWVPEGYVLADEGRNSMRIWKHYNNENNDIDIDIEISVIMIDEHTSITIDTEDAEVKFTTINGIEAIYTRKGNTSHLAWISAEDGMAFFILGVDLDFETITKIAENIELN